MMATGYPPHTYSGLTDACSYCGVRWEDVADGVASPSCDIARQVPVSRIVWPVIIGVAIACILIVGAFR